MPDSVNDKLQNRSIRHAVYLEGVKTYQQNIVLQFMNEDVLPEIQKIITNALSATPTKARPSGTNSTKRLKKMERDVNKAVNKGINKTYILNRDNMKKVAETEALFQVHMIEDAFPAPITLGTPSLTSMHQAVVNNPFQGETLRGWWDTVSVSGQNDILREINIGLVNGQSNQTIARRVWGTNSGSAFNKMRRNAVTIVRTATTEASQIAREQTYEKNADIIKGVQYVATLDSRTTEICASLDGKEFKVGQGPRPPMHMRCRSTTVPITKSWEEIGLGRFGLKEPTPQLRASANGRVPAKTTYPEWLSKQPQSVQNRVLGKGKAEIFRKDPSNPDEAFSRFVDTNFKPISLERVKQLEGIE